MTWPLDRNRLTLGAPAEERETNFCERGLIGADTEIPDLAAALVYSDGNEVTHLAIALRARP